MTALRHILAILPLPFVFLVVSPIFGGPAWAAPDKFQGFWITERYGSVVEVADCPHQAGAICGTIVWLWAAIEADGTPVLDARNPDDTLRQQPLIGRQILIDMHWDGDTAKGRIYNPEDGRTYRATIKAIDADTLHVEGCVMFLCQTQVWRRPSSLPRFDNSRA